MGKRPAARQGSPLWVTTADLPTSAGHPFFERLNRVLEEAGFDAFVEGLCAVFYAARMGRPSLRPGRYFRMLLIGYFEGLSSERGIAWRVADSLSLRSFLDLDVTEASPDHSTLSRTRRLIDVETHEAVFTWVLERLSAAGLVKGKTVGVDATTLRRTGRICWRLWRKESSLNGKQRTTTLQETSGGSSLDRGRSYTRPSPVWSGFLRSRESASRPRWRFSPPEWFADSTIPVQLCRLLRLAVPRTRYMGTFLGIFHEG